MSTIVPALVVAGTLALVVLGVTAWVARRRRKRRNAHRIAALTAVAERIDAAVASLGVTSASSSPGGASPARRAPSPPTPLVDEGLPGRAALLDAVTDAVDRVRAEGSRLSAAVVRVRGDEDASTLAPVVHEIAGGDAYAVGPRSVALVLPGLGRADALGVLARIEARCASSSRAVELETDEDAVEFAARLLAGRVGSVPQRSVPQRPVPEGD